MAKKKKADYTNIVASSGPVYMYSNFTNVDGVDLTSEGAHNFEYGGYHFIITVSTATNSVVGYCWTRTNWELTGLYDQEVSLIPVAANVQTSEPPLLVSKDSGGKYLREASFFTTQALTDSEAQRCVHYAQPTPPGFLGGDLVEAYMSSEQVISGRSTTYCGNANFASHLGFMTPAHQAIIGEGEPCATPDLHHIRAFYWSTNLNDAEQDFLMDLPAARDILTVAKVDMSDQGVEWATQVVRGVALDAL